MNIHRLRDRFLATTVLASFAVATAGTVFLAAPASAQDYTTGAITGTVVDDKNHGVPSATVTLRSQAQNQTRTFTTSSNGTFNAAGLASGTYDVTVKAAGMSDYSDTVTIVAAQESRVTVALAAAGSKEIVVTGTRLHQDFTKTTTGLNVSVVDIAKNAPVGRNLASIIALAPGTVPGDSRFGTGNSAVASIGGSSVSENAYYINGLNITNPDTYVGGSRVPFDFYQTVDVQTGGYAAEFGRATGGVINATTKSGTNTPFFGIHGNFEPAWQSSSPNQGDPNNPDTIGKLRKDYNESMTFEAGGPVVKDHVFLYGLFQPQSLITEQGRPADGYYEKAKSTTPFYGGKADVYINPTQHLEFTLFNTKEVLQRDRYEIFPNENFTNATIGTKAGSETETTGGLNWVGRYTGNITDWFQISGAYGVSKDQDTLAPSDTSSYYVEDLRSGSAQTISGQKFAQAEPLKTKRRFYRIDGDLRFSILGQHHVRFGMDNEDLTLTHTLVNNGVLPIVYSYRTQGVRLTYEHLGGHVSARDRAFYLQDSWQPFTGMVLNLGVRDDEFNQKNLSGQQYLNFKGNLAARAGFNYTPNGTSPFQFFGNYGRYFIPPAMNLGFRGKDDYFREYFAYPDGYTSDNFPIDSKTGLPLVDLGPALTTVSGYNSACPNDMSAAPGHPVNGAATCVLFGSNLQEPAYAKVGRGTKATHEDEFILGASYRVSNLISVSLTGTYRKLGKVSEDTDFSQELLDYYGCDGQTGNNALTGTAAQCARYALRNTYYIWNPGKSATLVDWVDPTKTVHLTNLDFPNPKRTYKAVVLKWNKKDDGIWNMEGSITWSKSKGNYEGTVSSDVGNAIQADAGSTVDFDYPGLAKNTYGLLPNDHRWSIKLAGGYHITKELYVGTNMQILSPMHGSCEGFDPFDPDAFGYGSISFYCGTGALDADGNYTEVANSPRGTGWKTDWLKQFDFAVRYTMPESWGLANGLTLRADLFNAFNGKAVLNRNPEQQIDSDGTFFQPNAAYKTPIAYQQPRYVRLGFDWLF